MGWNSWNAFSSNVSAALFQQMADAMVTSGMADAGYQYVNIDDTWSTKDASLVRAPDEALVPDRFKFPNGIAALADYVHGKGLKLGIYADRGILTCGNYPGSEGHEQQDATTFAGWGIDYVKYDNCPPTPRAHVRNDAARRTRPWATPFGPAGDRWCTASVPGRFTNGASRSGACGEPRATSNRIETRSWRTCRATSASPPTPVPMGGTTPICSRWEIFRRPSTEETDAVLTDYRAHFTLWAISAAPLITGNDLRHMSDAVKQILTNKEVIALDQDALGYQGVPVRSGGDLSVWAKPLNESGARGVVLFNPGDTATDITVSFAEIGLRSGAATVRDLWAHADLGSFTDSYTAHAVPAHDVVALRIVGQEPPRPPAGKVYLSDLPWIYGVNGLGPVERT